MAHRRSEAVSRPGLLLVAGTGRVSLALPSESHGPGVEGVTGTVPRRIGLLWAAFGDLQLVSDTVAAGVMNLVVRPRRYSS